jgi:hypothetical protein
MREFAFSPNGPKYRLVLLHHETPSKNPFKVKQTWTHFLRCPECGQRAGSLFLHQNELFCRACLDHPRKPPPGHLEKRIRNAEHQLIVYRGTRTRPNTVLVLRRQMIKLRRLQLGLRPRG